MKSLFWKELRESRLLLFLSAAIVLMVYIFSVVIKVRWFDFEMATGAAYLFLVLFALVFGVSAFSGELERDNLSFLISLPVTRNRIFWTKFLAGFTCLVFLSLFFLLLAFLFFFVSPVKRFLFQPGTSLFSGLLMIYVSVACYLYSTGFLLAALRVRVLPGIISGFPLAGILYLLLNPLSIILFGYSSPFGNSNKNYFNIFNIQATVFHVFLSAAIALFFAYYFWARYVTRGMSSFRPAIRTGITFLLFLALLYAGLNLLSTRQIATEIERIKSAGWPTSFREIVLKAKGVPDKENAAPIYQKAFGLLEEKYGRKDVTEAFRNLNINDFFNSFSQRGEEDRKKAFRIAGDNESVYLLIREATRLPGCHFPRNYPYVYNTMRILYAILAIRTKTESEQGDFNDSVGGIVSGIQMSEHLFADSTKSFSDLSIEGIDVFLKLLHDVYDRSDLNQSQLTQIAEKLNGVFGRKDIISILAGERVLYQMPNFRRMIYPRVHEIDPRITSHPGPAVFFYRGFLNFGYKQEYIAYLRISERELDLLAKPYYQTEDIFKKLEKEIKQPDYRHPFTKVFFSFLRNRLQIVRFETNLDLAKLATALKRFKLTRGQYPQGLTELQPDFISELPLDPFTGKDFIYRLEGKGFLLYSVGENEVDDIGKAIAEKTGKQSVAELSDIPWRQNR